MEYFNLKIKRVKPLIKIRKNQLEKEAAELARIRQEKQACVQKLRFYQDQYMQGIEYLNAERQSTDRSRLAPLERSVDTAKSQWYQSLKDLRLIESQEKAQISQLIIAERNLKSLEKLEERYVVDRHHHEIQSEQKFNDELNIRKFSQG